MTIDSQVPLSSVKLVIFDMDGTITAPYLDFDKIRTEIGLSPDCGPLLEMMEKMPPDELKRVEDILYKHEQLAIENSTLNPGAAETLNQLRFRSIPFGILTRNTAANAAAVADKHDLNFDVIIDRDSGPPKPDPFGVIHLCEHFGVLPSQAIVVGDYLFDLQSATAAGASAVLMVTGQNAKFAEHAHYTIDNLTQILDIIDERAVNL